MESVAAARETPISAEHRVWTNTYVRLCGVQFLVYWHEGLLLPTIPLYVAALGGSGAVVGLALAAFSVASFTIRPLLGVLTDRWSLVGVLVLGSVLLGLGGAGLLLPVLWIVFLANGLRGIGWAAHNTAAGTLLAHVAPLQRRAEAAGYVSFFQTAALSFAPPLALWLMGPSAIDFATVLVVAILSVVLGAVLASTVPRSVVPHLDSRDRAPRGSRSLAEQFWDPGVLLPSVLLALLMMTQPAVLSLVPLYARELQIGTDSVTWYYLVVGAIALVSRGVLGQFADRAGRGLGVVSGFILAAVGLLLIAAAPGLQLLMLGGVLYVVGQAVHMPAATALAIDRADPARRGTAMASFSLFFQVGLGAGALIAGLLVSISGYRAMYLASVVPLGAGLVVAAWNWRSIQSRPGRESSATS